MANVLWIGLGAVLGANARYFVSLWLAAKLGPAFPYGTLTVNAAGSLLLGFLVAAASHYLALSPQLRLLLFRRLPRLLHHLLHLRRRERRPLAERPRLGRPGQYPHQQRSQPPLRRARHPPGRSVS